MVLYYEFVCLFRPFSFPGYAHMSGVLFLWSLLFQGLLLCAFAGDYAGFPGCGLLRLHSTYRHDLKIYASDEGRVQMTAAAFAKVCLSFVCRDMLVLHNAFRWDWCELLFMLLFIYLFLFSFNLLFTLKKCTNTF